MAICYALTNLNDAQNNPVANVQRNLVAGNSYTPCDHLPVHDSTNYYLYRIRIYVPATGLIQEVTTGTITCPSTEFSLSYDFVRRTPPAEQLDCTVKTYLDGTLDCTEMRTGLSAGGTYTPSAHLPYYDSSVYSLGAIKMRVGSSQTETDVTSGSITCPNEDFHLDYYFVQRSTVSCYAQTYLDGVQSSSETRTGLYVGAPYTPSLHLPSYDPTVYELHQIGMYLPSTGAYTDVTTQTFTCPNENFYIDYFFQTRTAQTTAYIWDGSAWVQATPYIWDGSAWVQATTQIWDGVWK